MAALDKLPTEILHMIAGFLTIRDNINNIVLDQKALASLARVNTRLRDAFDSILWKTNKDHLAHEGDEDTYYPRSAILWAARRNRIDILEKASKYNLPLGLTRCGGPLHSAAVLGHDAAVRWLLDHGVPTDSGTSRKTFPENTHKARDTVPVYYSPLWAAIQAGQESTALILLSRGANIWFRRSYTPGIEFPEAAIHHAAFYGCTAVVEHLVLTMGIDVDELDSNLETPLNHAMKQPDNKDMIETLLELGADIDKELGSELPLTTAIIATNFDNAMSFLDARPRVNLSNTGPGSISPLAAWASYMPSSGWVSDDKPTPFEHSELFWKLIACGADVNAPCNELDTPLGIAIQRSNAIAIRELIIGGADIEKCTGDRQLKPIDLIWDLGDRRDIAIKGAILVAAGARLDVSSRVNSTTPLEEAASYKGGQPILRSFLCSASRQSFRDGYLDEVFQFCLESRRYESAKILKDHGASSQGAKKAVYNWAQDLARGYLDDPFHQALSFCLDFQFSHDEIGNVFAIALECRNLEICHLLLDRGLLSLSKEPRPWLHMAARHGSFSLTRRLCRAGMDINALDDCFETPMMAALLANHTNLADLLFDLGADPFHPRPDAGCRQLQNSDLEIISPFEYAMRFPCDHGYARRWWQDSPPELRPTEDLYTSRIISRGEDYFAFLFFDSLRRSAGSSSKDTGEQPTHRQVTAGAEEPSTLRIKILSAVKRLANPLEVVDYDLGWSGI
ncbi:ankyrin [Daldinia vernicosa]|uniref:ankyrin n=1 Tax=Daldinia vernicosa TaxID=114800 RepID=UPI00200758DD|nr:ankyrin [Daldinia vernicosa]KAI0847563.1 ankyrin [Daldinia vernicosa]